MIFLFPLSSSILNFLSEIHNCFFFSISHLHFFRYSSMFLKLPPFLHLLNHYSTKRRPLSSLTPNSTIFTPKPLNIQLARQTLSSLTFNTFFLNIQQTRQTLFSCIFSVGGLDSPITSSIWYCKIPQTN